MATSQQAFSQQAPHAFFQAAPFMWSRPTEAPHVAADAGPLGQNRWPNSTTTPPICKNHLYVSAWLHRKLILISLPRKFRLLFFPPALGVRFPSACQLVCGH